LKGGFFLFPGEKPHLPGVARGLAERIYCPFFAPFDEQIQNVTAGRLNYALLSDLSFRTLAIGQHVRLIDMRPWLSQ
jgi:hypothetical protein